MSTNPTKNTPNTNKTKEIFVSIVDQFTEELKHGKNPFTMLSDAENALSGTKYNGFNAFVLNFMAKEKGFDINKYLTFNQVSKFEEKAKVKKGAKSIPIFFWSKRFEVSYSYTLLTERLQKKEKVTANNELQAENLIKNKKGIFDISVSIVKELYPFLTKYNVFNLSDTTINYTPEIKSPKLNVEEVLASSEAEIVMTDRKICYFEGNTLYVNEDNYASLFQTFMAFVSKEHDFKKELSYEEKQIVYMIAAGMLASGCDVEYIVSEEILNLWIDRMETTPYSLFKYASEAQEIVDLIFAKITKKRATK